MLKFAQQHNFTYIKTPYNIFKAGKIQGNINNEPFFIGMHSTSYGFGSVAKQNFSEEKNLYMHLKVNGMPDKLVIYKQGSPKKSKIIDFLLVKTGIPMLKTGDMEFDNKVNIIGYKEEVLPWLTPQRRKAIIAFLSNENYIIRRGGVAYRFSKTYISLNHLEEVFTYLIKAQSKL